MTSSIAITTSTVSRLSRPRSLAKCDVPDNYEGEIMILEIFKYICLTLEASETYVVIISHSVRRIRTVPCQNSSIDQLSCPQLPPSTDLLGLNKIALLERLQPGQFVLT